VRQWDKIKVANAVRCIVEVCSGLQRVTPDKVDEYLEAIEEWGKKYLSKQAKKRLRKELEKIARR
jgi:hypothetical protein